MFFFQYLEVTMFPKIMGMVILESPDELRTILDSFIKILFMFASGESFAKVYVYSFLDDPFFHHQVFHCQ